MLFTNTSENGGDFKNVVESELNKNTDIVIASGYMSLDFIELYENKFFEIVRGGGTVRLLVGMAFYEGLNKKKLVKLTNLSAELKTLNSNSGVFIPYTRRFHGKIYRFKNSGVNSTHYIGSSNFSSSGLKSNMEATALIQSEVTKNKINDYIKYLFSKDISRTIDNLEIIVPGSRTYATKISASNLEELEKHDLGEINLNDFPSFEYDLSRISNSMKSSLNAYFAKGRLSRATGKIAPRGWYEGALIASSQLISNPLYPIGKFDAYTDDGYIIPLATRGANHKNIESVGNLKLLGMWIKSRLQKSGALVPLTPVTEETLDAYGRDNIKFYKLDEGRYYLDFSVNTNP